MGIENRIFSVDVYDGEKFHSSFTSDEISYSGNYSLPITKATLGEHNYSFHIRDNKGFSFSPELLSVIVADQDIDNAGWTSEQRDCNDSEIRINSGASEIPYDGIDQNCDNVDFIDVDEDILGDDCDSVLDLVGNFNSDNILDLMTV